MCGGGGCRGDRRGRDTSVRPPVATKCRRQSVVSVAGGGSHARRGLLRVASATSGGTFSHGYGGFCSNVRTLQILFVGTTVTPKSVDLPSSIVVSYLGPVVLEQGGPRGLRETLRFSNFYRIRKGQTNKRLQITITGTFLVLGSRTIVNFSKRLNPLLH